MRPQLDRRSLLDGLLAVAVVISSWATALFGQQPDHPEVGPWSRGARNGPGAGPEFGPPADLPWMVYPCLALLGVGIVLRRRRPRLAFVLIIVGVAGYLAAGGPYGPVLLAPALAVHALATALPFQRWAPLTLLFVPMLIARSWDQPYLGLLEPTFYGALVTSFALMALPAMFALLHRNRRESERLEREQELRRYAYEERLQIAREVHDVVGHSLSVINLQAGVALHLLNKRPDEVEASLAAIKRTSREALSELRTTLAVFRDPSGDEPRAPRPGLARLDDLLASLRAAGREVRVTHLRPSVDEPLPAAVDQAAYRIIQEALTNVVRHAGGAPASLVIDRDPRRVLVEVRDVGAGSPAQHLVEGSGILGMRERAAAVGGTLTVGRGQAGEFEVRAELPLRASTVQGAGAP